MVKTDLLVLNLRHDDAPEHWGNTECLGQASVRRHERDAAEAGIVVGALDQNSLNLVVAAFNFIAVRLIFEGDDIGNCLPIMHP